MNERSEIGSRWSLSWPWSRRRQERELDDELAFHVAMEQERLEGEGWSPRAARTEALRRFGGVEKTKEECRHERRGHTLDVLFQDVRYGLRSLARTPGFTLVVVLTLALGIGANTALFSLLHGILLDPLPYGDEERLVLLRQHAPGANLDAFGFSVPEIEDYRASLESVDALVEYHDMSFIILGPGEPVRVATGVVSADFFDVLGIQALHGRTLEAADEAQGAEAVLVLEHGFWQRHYGGDPEVVGKALEMNDRMHTVVGVLPPVPLYPEPQDVYMPTSACPIRSSEDVRTNRDARMMSLFGRLTPGATVAGLDGELDGVTTAFGAEHPEAYPESSGYTASARPLKREITGPVADPLWLLFGVVALVLLIACINVANLMLARQVRRQRELTVRSALGAGRGRLARQLITEALLLSLLGGAVGLAAAYAVLPLLLRWSADLLPRIGEVGVDGPVLLFTLGVAVVTGLVFGLLPALASPTDLAGVLRSSGERAGGDPLRHRLRQALVVGQVAVSFVVLLAAGLMVRSLIHLQTVDPGFEPERVIAFEISLNWSKYETMEERQGFYEELLGRLESQPRVVSAALVNNFPLSRTGQPRVRFEVEGEPVAESHLRPQADVNTVSDGYFDALGIPLRRGRSFDSRDGPEARPVVLVSEVFANLHFGAVDPLGRRISTDEGETWHTVVGVVADTRNHGLDQETVEGTVYFPFRQNPGAVWRGVVRASGEPRSLRRDIQQAVWSVDPRQPVSRMETLLEVRERKLAPSRHVTLLLSLFAGLALVITAAGIAGVLAFSVSQRTREIGVRMALGAPRSRVLGMILRQGLGLVAAGLGVGLLGALLTGGWLADLLFRVQPHDGLTLITVAALLAVIALVACLVPAWRALRIRPLLALRTD